MRKNNLSKIRIIGLLLLMTASCASPLIHVEPTGDMSLKLDQSLLKTAGSDLDIVPVSYTIEGSNDLGYTFDLVTSDADIQFPDLSSGLWLINVRAYNAQDLIIAEGTGSLSVESGGYASITIVLYSTMGTGSLDFSLAWNSDLVFNETVEISLINLNGDEIPLVYNQQSGLAAGITENLSAGFYTLEVQLFDDLFLVMGAMEIIQIREGGETDIHLDFAQINKPGQGFPVSGESFAIAWDYSETQPDYYNIYYREHGSFTWIFLGSTSSGSILEYTIDQALLPVGDYDFAVSSVIGIEESELHTSMDDNAIPATGWYIQWLGV